MFCGGKDTTAFAFVQEFRTKNLLFLQSPNIQHQTK